MAEQITRRDASQFEHYIALIDGNRGLKNRVRQDLPKFISIVDIIHVTEYLWEAGRCLYKEGSEELVEWVEEQKDLLYAGRAAEIVKEIGCLGGGHKFAAGAIIPKEKKEKFIEIAKNKLQ